MTTPNEPPRKPVPVTPVRDDHELLTRIDERTLAMQSAIEELESKLENKYVTQAEFWPVRTIVYSGAGLILIAVFGGLIALVVRGQ